MKNTTRLLGIAALLITGLAACNAAPPVDSQATIEAAVAATGAAQAANQATIEAAVAATTAAQAASQPTPTATLVVPPQATGQPTDLPPEVVAMTEEELAALIDQAVNEAVAATEQVAAASEQAAADGTVSPDEVQTVEVSFANADEAMAYAEELLGLYTSLYGELAVAAVDELSQVEDELAALVVAVDELNQVMAEVNTSLEQGVALAEETIAQIETAAQTVSETSQTVQSQTQAWQTTHQTDRDNRIATAVAVPPNQVSGDPQVAIKNVLDFVQTGQAATADGQISADELAQLAQLGANASAAAGQSGSLEMQELAGLLTTVTEHLAGGNIPQAQAGLAQLGVAAPLALPPDNIPQDPRSAIQTALEFASAGQQILQGDPPTPEQLVQLAQLGSNASAGLSASGMPQLQQLAGKVNDITGQISLGQPAQAQLQINQLGAALNSLPDINLPEKPNLPNRPSLPDKPARPSK